MATQGPTLSAGIALLRTHDDQPQVLLVHPGGPYWWNKDEHGWSIPKGELEDNERPGGPEAEFGDEVYATVARREFSEEIGHQLPDSELVALPELRLSSSKRLRAFATSGDLDPDTISSNTFDLEWPPRSGVIQSFPEVDRAGWFTFDEALLQLHKGQVGLIDHLVDHLVNHSVDHWERGSISLSRRESP